MAAKTPAETAQEFAQAALSLAPVIILGSGASAAHGVPGMWPLASHLAAVATPVDWTQAENEHWGRLLGLLKGGTDLEAALQAERAPDKLTQFIARSTREFLLPADMKVFSTLLADRNCLPLSRLYRHLFDSTQKVINVVTPNYDRLAEYAADAADFSTFTGFGYGYLQSRAKPETRVMVNKQVMRTVAVWKVHGSLDWFQDAAGQIVALPSAIQIPAGFSPLMVTPGIDKYRLTHGEPFRTVLACCDYALQDARAYLCVGYGFNDEHVQAKLVERCNKDAVPLIVITKELTPTAKQFLGSGRCRKYLAIEDNGTGGAHLFTHDVPGGFDDNRPIWQLDQFLDHVIGKATA